MQIRCGRGVVALLVSEISIDKIRLQKALSSSLLEPRDRRGKCLSVQEVIGKIPELKWGAKLKDFGSSFQFEIVILLTLCPQEI